MQKSRLETVQTRYRDANVAARYNASRYTGAEAALNLWAMRAAIAKALTGVPEGATVLDIPCGTGIFCWHLSQLGYKTIASDISLEMLEVARAVKHHDYQSSASQPLFFQGDVFHLPFRNDTMDAVLCMRFMNLVDRSTRIAAVREMARVAGILIVSYYHKYTFKYFGRWLRHNLGLRRPPNPRLSRAELFSEIAETGLNLRFLIPVAPLLSEAWIAMLERPASSNEAS